MKRKALILLLIFCAFPSGAQLRTLLNNDWYFSLGDASSMEKDFTHGTEYFTYMSKIASAAHSKSPIMPEFDDSSWRKLSLPHDWAVDLPFSPEASHSHGYKCIGWKYPGNSVGWYRKHLYVPASDKGRQLSIEFEGIFRDSEVFCNGIYLGHERSGYVSSVYDLTPYLNYGGDNVITVRCDASLEEGWYYEGAGIYRNVWLRKAGPAAVKPYSLDVRDGNPVFELQLRDASVDPEEVVTEITILDAEGRELDKPSRRWHPDDPYLYTAVIRLYYRGGLSDSIAVRFGLREIEFKPERGLLIDGKPFKLKGCNLHLDHAGVGTGVPDKLWEYRLRKIKEYGFNAVRCSHNPASPAMLDICDSLGLLVIDEARRPGVNREQMAELENMIGRDRNHPSVILWSVGNEEWSVEWSPKGTEIAARMTEAVHRLDPTRAATYGSSGGREMVKGVDVFGYNYIVQNPIDEYHGTYPDRVALGTEETSGAGTRGKYETVPSEGWMAPLNRQDTLGRINVIESGWKFYRDREWTAGLFYWTGQDYRGEPNPMKWPATGSQFGILDYCCFPKDEAFYLKSVWDSAPLVHVCGPCNGEVWVYSNCDEVTLYADGKRLGKKAMPEDGHLVWKVSPAMRSFRAAAYRGGKKVAADIWPEVLSGTELIPSAARLSSDGQDIVVVDIISPEKTLEVSVDNALFLGWGNGNPGFKSVERPHDGRSMTIETFSGRAQLIVRSIEGSSGKATVTVGDKILVLEII